MQKDGSYVSFQSFNFGVNSDISVGEDGLHFGECVFSQSYSFLYFCVASVTLSTVTVVRMFCSFSSEPTINTVSSAYLRLFMLLPSTLSPS